MIKSFWAEDWNEVNYCMHCGKAIKVKEEK